jgi:hypothetical protein
MPYFHYTSQKAAQDIICGLPSRIHPGPSGKIYVTLARYTEGYEAASELAITKLVEVGCEIPDARVVSPSAPGRVKKIKGPGGMIVRRGRGIELTTAQSIDANGLQWIALDPP